MNSAGLSAHFTPITADLVPHNSDRYVAALVEKLQRRLDAYQRQTVGAAAILSTDGHSHHHSRSASGNAILVGSKRLGGGGGGGIGMNSPDEVSFVFSVGEGTALHAPGTGPISGSSGGGGGAGGVASSTETPLPPAVPATTDIVRVRPRSSSINHAHSTSSGGGGGGGGSSGAYTEERELCAVAEELCTELNGGVNYRVLCQQYAAALDAVTTMVRQDIAMLRSSVVLPQPSVAKLSEEMHALLSESARLLKEAGVVDLTGRFARDVPSGTGAEPSVSGVMSEPGIYGKPPMSPTAARAAAAEMAARAGLASAVDEEVSQHRQMLNRVNTEPYMRALANAEGRPAAAHDVGTAHPSAQSRGSEIGSGMLFVESVDPSVATFGESLTRLATKPETSVGDKAPAQGPHVDEPDLTTAAEREASPVPHAVRAASARPYMPTPPPYSVPRHATSGRGHSASAPSTTAAQAAPTRRLRRLEQLFGEAYTHDGDQFLRDVLGVVFRYQYDALPSAESAMASANGFSGGPVSAAVAAAAAAAAAAGALSSTTSSYQSAGPHRPGRSASTASTNSTSSVPNTEALARFRDFKQHTTSVISGSLACYDAFKEGSFDSTPLRGDYVYQCLLSHTKPHESILALLDDIRDDRNVEVLNLSGTHLGDAAAGSLLLLLPRLYRLHTLNLQQCDLHDATVVKLAGCARAHPTLRHIDLSRNEITDAAFEDLVSLYVSVPNVEEVRLVGCPLTTYTRNQIEGVRGITAVSPFGERQNAVRSQLEASPLAPVRSRSALHSYASLKSTVRRTSQPRRGQAPYAPFAASAPATGVYARSSERDVRRPSAGGAVTSSLPPLRPY